VVLDHAKPINGRASVSFNGFARLTANAIVAVLAQASVAIQQKDVYTDLRFEIGEWQFISLQLLWRRCKHLSLLKLSDNRLGIGGDLGHRTSAFQFASRCGDPTNRAIRYFCKLAGAGRSCPTEGTELHP
jgi:hypothetical protein